QAHDGALSHRGHEGAAAVSRVDEERQRVAGPAHAVRWPRSGLAGQGRGLGDVGLPALKRDVIAPALIHARGVHKTYRTQDGEAERLKPLTFEIRAGEFVSVVGPSGCGKSPLMKMVAGLLPITGGELTLSGQPVHGPQTNVGIVFQTATLLPWRRVIDNILLQAEIRGLPMDAARRRAQQLVDMAG